MKKLVVLIVATLLGASAAESQDIRFARLSLEELEVMPPSGRVVGPPGRMRVTERLCQSVTDGNLRRRIVDVAVQEWGFFGFGVVDQTNLVDEEPRRRRPRRRTSWLGPEESARVADTIAGYWAITSDGAWILDRQNAIWKGPEGVAARWRDPWSAAFISWVMCESGLYDDAKFQRAIAHHTYIDQAIRARDDLTSEAAFVAHNVGEHTIEPGDLLCAARRPNYRRLEERLETIGTGIRSHCDIVVQLDANKDRILVIGGNVRGAVSLKIHPAVFADDGVSVESVGRGRRSIFAHLKLRAEPIGSEALADSPTVRALDERGDAWLRRRLVGGTSPRLDVVTTSAPSGAASSSPGQAAAL